MKNAFDTTITLSVAVLIGSFQCLAQISRSFITETVDGGSVTVVNSDGARTLNRDSALRRLWHTMNDDSCPIQLHKAGVKPLQIGDSFLYQPVVESFTAKEPITAVEINSALYDVFNENIITLVITRVEDMASHDSPMFQTALQQSSFNARRTDVERLLTVVSFVSQVRTKNGTVWRYDAASLVSEIARLLHSKVTETTLKPPITAH